jgi:hypothetical protein
MSMKKAPTSGTTTNTTKSVTTATWPTSSSRIGPD